MAASEANKGKAQFIFDSVFGQLKVQWIGPEHDFDRDSYKARIQSGPKKGQLVYISDERLEDANVSAEDIKQDLLRHLS
jgi:hypothetical protein